MDKNYEALKKKLEEKTGDSTPLTNAIEGTEIPLESLAAMGANMTLDSFLEEMKRHGLEVWIAPARKKPDDQPTEEEIGAVSLTDFLEATHENRERYLKLLHKARENLHDTGFIQAFLESGPSEGREPVNEEALDILNAASYQGDFGELRELSKKLKKHED